MDEELSLGETEDSGHGDLVLLAVLVSRVEAVVLASMLEAAGIDVHVGGLNHASVEVNSLALGGHRLMVPNRQYRDASEIVREAGAGEECWRFSRGLRRAVLKFLALWVSLNAGIVAMGVWAVGLPPFYLLATPLAALTVPVNPQGRGDFYLAPAVAGR